MYVQKKKEDTPQEFLESLVDIIKRFNDSYFSTARTLDKNSPRVLRKSEDIKRLQDQILTGGDVGYVLPASEKGAVEYYAALLDHVRRALKDEYGLAVTGSVQRAPAKIPLGGGKTADGLELRFGFARGTTPSQIALAVANHKPADAGKRLGEEEEPALLEDTPARKTPATAQPPAFDTHTVPVKELQALGKKDQRGERAALDAQNAQSYSRLREYLDALSRTPSFDNLEVAQEAAEQVERYYKTLSSNGAAEQAAGLMKEYRAKLMPSLREGITPEGKLAVDAGNAAILPQRVKKLVETVVLYNTFDKAASEYVLRGVPPADLPGFQSAFVRLRGDGVTPSEHEPYLNDILAARYGPQGQSLAGARSVLGLPASNASPARQYYEMLESIVVQNDEGRRQLDRAYTAWRTFAERYPSSGSPVDPLAILSGAGAGGQTPYSYTLYPAKTARSDSRNTFDFAAQLAAAKTFGRDLPALTPGEILAAVQSGTAMPAGTQSLYFGRKDFFQRISQFKFLGEARGLSPLEERDPTLKDALKADFYTVVSRYLTTLYYMQKDPLQRHKTVEEAMDRFMRAIESAGDRVDELQSRLADPAALNRGNIAVPMVYMATGVPIFLPSTDANLMGRLQFTSIFQGMSIPEITKTMSFQPSNMMQNFATNRYYADDYIRRLVSTRALELNTSPNYLHFRPSYESVLGGLSAAFNAARDNMAELEWNPTSQSLALFAGEGRYADGVGVDAQWTARGLNPAQTGMLEAFYLPATGVKQAMARGELTQTEVLGANVWDLMARVDNTVREGAAPAPGVTVEPVTDVYSIANLDATYGIADGMCSAKFWGRSQTGGNPAVSETYYGTAYLRQSGQWLKVIFDHDAIVRDPGLKDALDHAFAQGNLQGGDGYTLRAALEADTWDYRNQGYDQSRTGRMFVGRLPPAANLVAGASRSIDRETGAAASAQVGQQTYITAMTYQFHDRDIGAGGWSYGASGGIVGGTGRSHDFRLYDRPLENPSTESYIAAVDYHIDNQFRALVFGGATDALVAGTREARTLGAELTWPENYLGVQATDDPATARLDRGLLRAFGKVAGLPRTDYALYGDFTRGQPGLAYGGITHRLGPNAEIGSVTLFGTTKELAGSFTPLAAASLAGQAKNLIDGIAAKASPTREDHVLSLLSMRELANAAIAQSPENFWASSGAYQLGIAYSSYRTKTDRPWYQDVDGMFLLGQVRDPATGQTTQTWAGAFNYRNQVGLFATYRSDTEYGVGIKGGLSEGRDGQPGTVAGLYFSAIQPPGTPVGSSPKMVTADAAGRGLFGGNVQTSGALSVGSEGSYRLHFFNAVDVMGQDAGGKKRQEGEAFGQLDLYRYSTPSGPFGGWEAGAGYQSGGFTMATLGASQLFWKMYGGVGQVVTDPRTGNYVNIGASMFDNTQALQFDLRAMVDKGSNYWNAQLTYRYNW